MSLDNPSTSHQRYLRIIDIGTCIGCGACEAACDFIHDGKPYIKVYRTSLGLEIPVSCLHCAKAPCIDVCPTGAMTRDREGAVYVIPSKCIGCMACLYACPFGIPQLDRGLRISTKCDLCYDQRKKGLEPGCSSLCPTGAIVYSADPVVFDIAKKKTAESWAKARYESLK
ncbi:MAG: 4Fe-4S dicluster domain-containing protein [Thermosphaera aggregans]|jgi:Fe-S-cluster-containing dehydrogenase component|uniref:4Fe-4S dicluster domain-containing protein n=1 Tax=Thermosphaera aggregans TaxID=54254 RepID=UPI003C11883B